MMPKHKTKQSCCPLGDYERQMRKKTKRENEGEGGMKN